jgi:glycosyltransferase involved in cell wall biosynthesis
MARVLYVTTVSSTLGFLSPLARHFRNRGWRVDAMARDVSGSNEFRNVFDQVWDACWSRNPMDPRNLLTATNQVKKAVSRGEYDIVHVHTPIAALVTRYALRRRTVPSKPCVIYTAHGFHFHPQGGRLRNAIFRSLEKLGGRWTDFLVVINKTDEEAARTFGIVSPEKVWYVPGVGVNLQKFVPSAVNAVDVQKVRGEMKLAPGQPLVVMVAEFIPRKRHSDVLRAFARTARTDAHLAFAGTGPCESAMQEMAKSLGLEDRVHFMGFRPDVSALIRASIATILPSTHEGLSCSVMESLSLEVPVIGSDIRGIRDLVGGDAGILVELGDVDGLAGAIDELLSHPEQARTMGSVGRSRMKEFDLVRVLQCHERLYERALSWLAS